MNTPGISIFQGAESIKINTSFDRLEEEEAAEDQRRRNEEVSIEFYLHKEKYSRNLFFIFEFNFYLLYPLSPKPTFDKQKTNLMS